MGVRVVRSEDRTIRTVYDPCPARFEVMIGGEQQLGIDGNDELISEFRQKQERSWKRRGLRLLVPFPNVVDKSIGMENAERQKEMQP